VVALAPGARDPLSEPAARIRPRGTSAPIVTRGTSPPTPPPIALLWSC